MYVPPLNVPQRRAAAEIAPSVSGFAVAEDTRRGDADPMIAQKPDNVETTRRTKASVNKVTMALYELRTYTLQVGKMAEAVKLHQEIGFLALQRGSQDKKLIG
jgi:hypothetical protein